MFVDLHVFSVDACVEPRFLPNDLRSVCVVLLPDGPVVSSKPVLHFFSPTSRDPLNRAGLGPGCEGPASAMLV